MNGNDTNHTPNAPDVIRRRMLRAMVAAPVLHAELAEANVADRVGHRGHTAPAHRNGAHPKYFPGEARNARDGIYDPDLLMAMAKPGIGGDARFDFVLDLP